MSIETTLAQTFSSETILAALLYLGLGTLYLLIIPLILYFYMSKRWYVVSSVERLFMYFLVFMFFPGLLLFSPFLNLRPERRQLGT